VGIGGEDRRRRNHGDDDKREKCNDGVGKRGGYREKSDRNLDPGCCYGLSETSGYRIAPMRSSYTVSLLSLFLANLIA
jgi:hypothetical protein